MKRLISLLALSTAMVGLVALPPTAAEVSLAQSIPQPASATRTPDSRVTQALDTLGFNYDIEENGTISIQFRFDEDRTQVAFITSGTSMLGDMELREIASPVNITEGPLPSGMANALLRDNASKKLGAWQVIELDDQRNLTIFTAQIDADISPEDLRAALFAVLRTADEMEAELTGGNQF